MTRTGTAHLILHPEPDLASDDLSWLYRAVDAAERAVFDAVAAPHPGPRVPVESSTLLAALAARTSQIGLIAQVSPQYVAPYNQARMLNTLDNFSAGRAAWRLVTADEDDPAGLHPPTTPAADRYLRAAELVTVLHSLWDSWEPDAVVADAETGVYVENSRLRPIDHAGDYYRVAGPLNLPRSPQRHPPLFVGVDSPRAAAFARSHADVAITTGGREDLSGVPVVLLDIYPDVTDAAALADRLAAISDTGEVDGYMLHLTPADLDRFVAEVLPQLQDAGVVADRYNSSTLRDRLDLDVSTAGAPS